MKTSDLRQKVVAIRDPHNYGKVILRRVVGTPNEWVQRSDDGGFIQVPLEHLWVESENKDDRQNDSLTKYGPLTRKLVVGEVKRVVWPPWKWDTMQAVEDRATVELSLQGKYRTYCRTMKEEEIYRRYGRPKYSEYEPENSEIPGWTKGI